MSYAITRDHDVTAPEWYAPGGGYERTGCYDREARRDHWKGTAAELAGAAIAQSIDQAGIVHLVVKGDEIITDPVAAELYRRCRDFAESGDDTIEFWGQTIDGHTWRVHVIGER